MSLQNVEKFYQRLIKDENFRNQLQEVKTEEESTQLVRNAGYDFTQEEFDSYTGKLLESNEAEGELRDVAEEELEMVLGGCRFVWPRFPLPQPQPLYGVVQPLYGVVISPDA